MEETRVFSEFLNTWFESIIFQRLMDSFDVGFLDFTEWVSLLQL